MTMIDSSEDLGGIRYLKALSPPPLKLGPKNAEDFENLVSNIYIGSNASLKS